MRASIAAVLGSRVSALGVALATACGLLFLALLALDAFGALQNPYTGLVTFVFVPGLFILGLLLIPIGLSLERRGVGANALLFVAGMTVINFAIVSAASYGAVEYTESPQFCGLVCHEPMEPQYSSYQAWPHARVACAACHVGPGPGARIEAKIAGTRQLLLAATGRHARPIPSPVESMRPARETCEQCHWPEKFHGDKIKVIREYSDDQANTETVTTMRLRVGGGSRAIGVGTGIHWHMNLDNEIEYVATDPTRQTIPYVRLRDRAGTVREFVVAGTTPAQLAAGTRRRMDCMDCHNRPAHTFSATAQRAVDASLAQGAIPRELAFVRREAVAAVGAEYGDRAEALRAIAERLERFYADRGGADPRLVARAVAGAQETWSRNVFPAMRVTWGTYPNQRGHVDAPGCFRCHDDEHKAGDGTLIRQDCELCHTIE